MRQLLSTAILVEAMFVLVGCGTNRITTPPPNPAVTITAQPLSQTVPLGQTATFTVVATGAAPLSYQWSENGVEISGATSAPYTSLRSRWARTAQSQSVLFR